MKRILLLLLLLPQWLVAQGVHDDFDFVFYLLGNGMKEDALTLLSRQADDGDSVSFLKGYTLYNNRQLSDAATSFGQVAPRSALYDESCFFGALCCAHLSRYDESLTRLQRVSANDDLLNVKYFEMAGVALLQRDYGAFDAAFLRLDTLDYRLSTEAADLLYLRNELGNHRRKSYALAGGLSAVVPGLGQTYAGNLGAGAAAFLVTGSMMAVTAENIVKEGWTNWKTILFGSLSAVFYVGNIYGAVAMVKVNYETYNNQKDVQILYDIHIPLRSTFRR
ncbi:MAG: hypothetical protein K6E93_03770 [Bacteroidales bacterium]|nr:hypothetical protein [Bacteroidales bacterium]